MMINGNSEENVMEQQEQKAMVAAVAQLQDLYHRFSVPNNIRKMISDNDKSPRYNCATDMRAWLVSMGNEFGHDSEVFTDFMKRTCSTIKGIRERRLERSEDSMQKRIHKAVSECRTQMTGALYAAEGRMFDWFVDVNFKHLDGDELIRPDVLYMETMRPDGRHKCKMVVTPAWAKRVGRDRAVFTHNGMKTFMYDSEEFFNRSMMEAGVTCLRAKVFGLLGSSAYRVLSDRIKEELEDATAEESGPLVNELQAMSIAYKEKRPYKYELYYLESQVLRDDDGNKIFSVGLTMDKARSLMDSRIKSYTLKALSI